MLNLNNNHMKTLVIALVFLFCFNIYASEASNAEANLEVAAFTYDNYLLNSNVDFFVTLRNIGDKAASNIQLKVVYVASDSPNYYTGEVFFNWGSKLLAGSQIQKKFKIKLPVGYDVSSATISVTYNR